MLPVLVALGPVKIYSMGVFLTLGLFFGLYYWWKLGRDEHWDEIALFDSFFLSLSAFFIFGRLGYVILHWSDLGTVYRILAFLTYPGLSYIAGIAGAVMTTISFARAKEWEVWKALDMLAVTLTLSLFFGFVGALLNGSNPGREVSYGLAFPGVSGPRIPVDLWGIIWAAVAFVVAIRVRKNFRFYDWYKVATSQAKDGLSALVTLTVAGLYLAVKGPLDDGQLLFGVFPAATLSGILIMLTGLLSIYVRSGRSTLGRKKL